MRKCDCANDSTSENEVAEAIEQIRQYGYRIESKKEYCSICNAETVHYRLILPRNLEKQVEL